MKIILNQEYPEELYNRVYHKVNSFISENYFKILKIKLELFIIKS